MAAATSERTTVREEGEEEDEMDGANSAAAKI